MESIFGSSIPNAVHLLLFNPFTTGTRQHQSIPTLRLLGMSTISLKIEFGGGLELLFDNKRSHRIDLPARIPAASSSTAASEEASDRPTDVQYLIHWLKDNLLKERAELFIEEGTVYVRTSTAGLPVPTDYHLQTAWDSRAHQ